MYFSCYVYFFLYLAAVGVMMGREVGRVAGGQSAAIAAAEELSKMNMAEITEEKAMALKGHFMELGTRIGKETGTKAGEAAGKDIDMTLPLKEATEAAKHAAEKGAMKAKELVDALKDKAERAAADAGEKAGKVFFVKLSSRNSVQPWWLDLLRRQFLIQ